MDRIASTFHKLKDRGEGALICYLPIIDPDLRSSLEIAEVFINAGVDIVELSIPSILPWLDGRAMQLHHKTSVKNRATVDTAFALAKMLRIKYPEWPIAPMSDYSGVMAYGIDRFIEQCISSDVDAVEIPDYPAFGKNDPHNFRQKLRSRNIEFISFCDGLSHAVDPSDEYQLFYKIVADSKGFLFLMATPGVTGRRNDIAEDYLRTAVSNMRKAQNELNTNFPILIGFGLSSAEHVGKVVNDIMADGVIVGSAVSELIHARSSKNELTTFIHSLKIATKKRSKSG